MNSQILIKLLSDDLLDQLNCELEEFVENNEVSSDLWELPFQAIRKIKRLLLDDAFEILDSIKANDIIGVLLKKNWEIGLGLTH